jgi:DNA-binding transcriptional LysR family regulator
MNERQLRYACGVWRERSFSRAAEKLHVSQPSLSDQVRLLEEEIGFPVFYRGARGIEPSVNGLTFLEHAEQVLEKMNRLEALGRRLRGQEQEQIRVGFNTGIADRFLPRVAEVVAGQSAKFRLEVATSTNRRLQRMIYQDKLDVGFLLGAQMENWAQKLKVESTLPSDIVLIVPPGHTLAQADTPPSIQAIALYPLVVSETELGSGRAVMALFKDAAIEPGVVADCDNVESVKAMVVAGLGVALLPRLCVEREVADGKLVARALEKPCAIAVQLVRSTRPLLPAIESCIAALVQQVMAGS